MNQTGEPNRAVDPFLRANAYLIVLVTFIGGIVGWRASVDSAAATQADTTGLVATLAAEQSRAQIASTSTQHLTAYSEYALNKALGDALNTILEVKYQGMRLPSNPAATARINEIVRGLEQRRNEAYDMASANQYLFSTRFLLPNGDYDAQRNWQASAEQASLAQDVDPMAHFIEADYMRARSTSLVGLLMVCALVTLVFALAMKLRQGTLAYALMAVGLLLTLGLIAAIIAVEMDMLVILPNLPFMGQVLP